MLAKRISAHRLIMLLCQILTGLILCLFFSSGPAPSPSSFLPSPSPQPSQSPAAARTPQNFSVPSPGPLNTPGKWSESYTADHELVYVLVTVIVPRKPVIISHDVNFKELYKAASIASSERHTHHITQQHGYLKSKSTETSFFITELCNGFIWLPQSFEKKNDT